MYSHKIHMHAETLRRNEDARTQVFRKIYLSLYWRVVCERELEIEQNCNVLTPTLMVITAFLSRSPGLLNREPSLSGTWSSFQHLLSNWSELQLLDQGPWGPSLLAAGSLYSILSPTDTNFLCTELYYCFTPTQSLPITGQRNMQLPPSLEWHVWSSSSRNNCHSVHRWPSFGASVCDFTMGF